MSEDQGQPSILSLDKSLLLAEQIRELIDFNRKILDNSSAMERVNASMERVNTSLIEQRSKELALTGSIMKTLDEKVMPSLKQLAEEQKKLSSGQDQTRGAMFGKLEVLQESMNIMKLDIRSVRKTADFAVTYSGDTREETDRYYRNTREETNQLLSLILTIQAQYQLLESRFELLKRTIAEKDDEV